MIRIDFFWAISIYVSLTILLVIGHWIIYTCGKERNILNNAKFIEQCPYCTSVFFDYADEGSIKICPRCKSYITAEHQDRESKF